MLNNYSKKSEGTFSTNWKGMGSVLMIFCHLHKISDRLCASPPYGGSGYEKPQSGCRPLCSFS
ncbi:MAG: hypothetical protein LBU85_05500, partial [Treponema sp.]|nr:hypothetical protein [Treponema sp.]